MSRAAQRVLVVGAGPAGCIAAIAHARAGAQVCLCEANPRAAERRLAGEWLHPAGADVLRELGVDLTGAFAGRGFVVHPEDGSEPISLPYVDGSLGFSWHHHELVERLRETAAAEPGVTYLPGTKVTSIESDGATLQAPKGATADAPRGPLPFDRIIGAEGKNSLTAKQLGQREERESVSRMCGVTLRGAKLPREDYGHVVLGGPGPMMIYRVGLDAIRVCIDAPSWFDLPKDKAAAARSLLLAYGPALPVELQAPFAQALLNDKLQWVTNAVRIRPAARQAGYGTDADPKRGRVSQLALIGDAVGYYHPLTAVGMTNGMLDATALSEHATVRDYARQRARQSRMTGMLSVALYDMFVAPGPDGRQMRQALYQVWRDSSAERRRTMRYLAAQDDRVLAFMGSFLRVVARGLAGGTMRAAPGNRLNTLSHGSSFLARRMPWLAKSLGRGRPLAARMLKAADSAPVPPPAGGKVAALRAPPVADVDRSRPERAPAQARLHEDLAESASALLEAQDHEGAWEGEVVWCAMLAAQYVLTHRALGRELPERDQVRVLQQFRVTQRDDGTWGLHEVSGPYLFVTTLVYAAARLLGVSADDPLLARAGAFIRAEGGATQMPSWGKLWLAISGLYDWRGVHPVLPEAWLLPKSLPLHPANWYCHTRIIYLAMASLYGRAFHAPLDATTHALREELFVESWDQIDWPSIRSAVRAAEVFAFPSPGMQVLNRLSALAGKLSPKRARKRALAKLREHIKFELDTTEGAGISPVSGMLNVIALHAADPHDSDIERALEGMQKWIWRDDIKGLRVAGARSATWDTSFAVQALAALPRGAAPTSALREALARGHRYIESQQILDTPAHRERFDKDDTRGGFCFGHAWHGWPVSDCTAEALIALLESGEPVSDARVRVATQFILNCQNRDGGFGSYEAKRTRVSLDWVNPAELFGESTTEASYPECTASSLAGLAAARPRIVALDDASLLAAVDASIERGAAFLRRAQRSDGGWPGNWGVGDVYGTWFGIRGLRAAGALPHDPAIVRARAFLCRHQRPDGAWGEAPESCLGDEVVAHAEGQVVHTAWGMLALIESGAPHFAELDAAAAFLSSRRNADGTWPKQDPAGVFFRTALLDYELYRAYFPAWAMGAYVAQRRALARDESPRDATFAA